MTLEEFWDSSLSDWVVLAMIPLNFVCLIFSQYLIRHHLDAMMEALKNSRFMVVWPRASIRLGDVGPMDVKNFPPHLKRLLIVKMTMMITAVIWMMIAAVLIKFR